MLFSFIETRLFARLREKYLADDEYASLQAILMEMPERGSLVPGSGGVEGLIWMLTMYAKNEEPVIPAHVLRKMKEEIDG